MARYVIDAPTLLHLVQHRVTVDPGHQLVASNAVRSEVMQLLLEAVRRGELADEEALQLHERMTELKLRLLGDRGSRTTAWRIARERGAGSFREAELVAIARLQGDALVTIDPEMAGAAEGVVPVAPLESLLRAER